MKTYSSLVTCNGNLLASIDLETTGTQPGYHEIIQIAIVPLNSDIRPLQELPVFYQNIKPKFPKRASKAATAKHGITIEDLVLEAPESEKVEDMLVEWFERLELPFGKVLVPLAHNWAFECSFLKAWLGVDMVDKVFHSHARDGMLTAIHLNDRRGLRRRTGALQPGRPRIGLPEVRHHEHARSRRPGRCLRWGRSISGNVPGDGLMSDTQVTTVFKTTDWNALIDQVKVLVNANPGCVSAAPPTDAVDPHVWTLQDVLGIQQVLQQLCNTDTFTTPVGPENLWLQKIIDEINTAIKNGACSCQECIKTCNPGVKNVDFSITQSGCEDMPIDLNAPDPTKQTRDAQNAAGLIGQKADGACSDYIDGFASYCGLQQHIKCAKLWLAQYQQETGPTKDADIAIAQAQIQRLTTQADAAKTTYQAAMASANSYAAACLAAMNAINFYPNGSINLMKYVPKTPWATPDCATPRRGAPPTRRRVRSLPGSLAIQRLLGRPRARASVE